MSEQTIDHEYFGGLELIAGGFQTLSMLDLDKMAAKVSQMEAVAPILVPTAYARGGMKNLHDQSRLIAAARRFVADVEKMRPAEVSR